MTMFCYHRNLYTYWFTHIWTQVHADWLFQWNHHTAKTAHMNQIQVAWQVVSCLNQLLGLSSWWRNTRWCDSLWGTSECWHEDKSLQAGKAAQPEAAGGLEELTPLMSCSTPHHTNCSPEPQDPCSINYFHLRYFEGSESFSSIQCLVVKTDI